MTYPRRPHDREIRITPRELVRNYDHFRNLSEEEALQWIIGEDTYEYIEVGTIMHSGGTMEIRIWDRR